MRLYLSTFFFLIEYTWLSTFTRIFSELIYDNVIHKKMRKFSFRIQSLNKYMPYKLRLQIINSARYV